MDYFAKQEGDIRFRKIICGDGICSALENCCRCKKDCPGACLPSTCKKTAEEDIEIEYVETPKTPPEETKEETIIEKIEEFFMFGGGVAGEGKEGGDETPETPPETYVPPPEEEKKIVYVCGDGVCDPVEDCCKCSEDCGGLCEGDACSTGCGDGFCDTAYETCCDCNADCPGTCVSGICS